MICKDKLFIIDSIVDDSIKMQTAVYDITIFKSIMEFESYVEKVPVIVSALIVTTNALEFTSSNVKRLMHVLESPFLTITESVIYLVDLDYSIEQVKEFVDKNRLDWAIYQERLDVEYISSIVSGEGRRSAEEQVEIVTYRLRASEYVRQQNEKKLQEGKLDVDYKVDDELFDDVPKEEMIEDTNPSVEYETSVQYVTGERTLERTVLVWLMAQYLSLEGKTVIIDKDTEYHTLLDLASKSGVPYYFVEAKELFEDFQSKLQEIVATTDKLVLIGSRSRNVYDYDFLFDVLVSNLKDSIGYFIRECELEESLYEREYTVAVKNTAPDVIRLCNLSRDCLDPRHVSVVGVQIGQLGAVNLSSKEINSILSSLLGNSSYKSRLVGISGLKLKGEDKVYDIFSFVKRKSIR